MLFLGTFFHVSLLLLNAVAVLNEERFLARGMWPFPGGLWKVYWKPREVGWTYSSLQPRDVNTGFQQPYDQNGYGGPAPGSSEVKARMIDLIRAVRALRSTSPLLNPKTPIYPLPVPLIFVNTLVILWKLVWAWNPRRHVLRHIHSVWVELLLLSTNDNPIAWTWPCCSDVDSTTGVVLGALLCLGFESTKETQYKEGTWVQLPAIKHLITCLICVVQMPVLVFDLTNEIIRLVAILR